MDEVKNCDYKQSLETIKTGLLSIKPAGHGGFEGLLSLILTKLTGIPFRLAASGLQGGLDGDAATGDFVCFEAKRYSGSVSRAEVITKIADLARNSTSADRLWVLGATTEISAQLANDIKCDGNQNAISTLILDWTASPLPLLAVALVNLDGEAIDFITENYCEKSTDIKLPKNNLKEAFSTIRSHPEFKNILQRIESALNTSQLALKQSLELNVEWRQQTFNSETFARERLGQKLAVLEDRTFPRMREKLLERVLVDIRAGKNVALVGDEGHGKSWLAAQLCCKTQGLALFISAESLEQISLGDLENFLIRTLIKQTDDTVNEAIDCRWRHRFLAWKNNPPESYLLVVVDGLNQRQNLRWDKILNHLQHVLADIGGRLVVTVRPNFWKKSISRGLTFSVVDINVPEWEPNERDKLLTHYGIALTWLDQKTLQTLRNPRLLSIAVNTLPHSAAMAWKGLTTARLLMEHLLSSQRENFEDDNFCELTERLRCHAIQVMNNLGPSANIPKNFKSDTDAVIETRFFKPLSGPGNWYELREDGLTLALGFMLMDQLWHTMRENHDLSVRITQLIEPVSALDRIADVLFSCLWICVLDDEHFDSKIFVVLLDAFSNLQNVDDHRFEEFVEVLKLKPQELFDALRTFCLESGTRINQDWFVQAVFEIIDSDEGWAVAKIAIKEWLNCYNKDHIAQTRRHQRQGIDEHKNCLEQKRVAISAVLASLSTIENQMLESMSEVSGEPDELFTLAFKLLSGRSLVDFADSFVAIGLAFALDTNLYWSRNAFQQLTTFNRVDRTQTRDAFLKAIEPLREGRISRSGKWTVVRMLNATGCERDAAIAHGLISELRKDEHKFELPPSDEWRQAKVANPYGIRPINMDEGKAQFKSLSTENMLQSMGMTSEDLSYKSFLPVACRFEPNIAINKTRDILSGICTRTGMSLRQVIVNCQEHLPLVTEELAKKIILRVEDDNSFDTIPKDDHMLCRMIAYDYVATKISHKEQLRCLTSKVFGDNYLLSVIPSFKEQPTESISSYLESALRSGDEDVAYCVIVTAFYGKTIVNKYLEKLVLESSKGNLSRLRAAAFELAIDRQLESVREAHAKSEWNALLADKNTHEKWFGSMLLVESNLKSELSIEELIKRIDPSTWFSAADMIGEKFIEPLAICFVEKLMAALGHISKINLPLIELTLCSSDPIPFPLISFDEIDGDEKRFSKQKNIKELLNVDFNEKQKSLRSLADTFLAEINGQNANIFLQGISLSSFQNLVIHCPNLLHNLIEILDRADSSKFVWLKNLAFLVANQTAKIDSEKAVKIFERAILSKSLITHSLGDGLTLEHEAIWSCPPSKKIQKLWISRLLDAENDLVLAREVHASEKFGAKEFTNTLVNQLLLSNDTLDKAYAITILGYLNPTERATFANNEHINDKGLFGQAAKHSLSEYENAVWSKHWFDMMCDASSSEEFWQYLMILKTCMDARTSECIPEGTKWRCYSSVYERARSASIKERDKQREKTLLGQKAPEQIFICPYNS